MLRENEDGNPVGKTHRYGIRNHADVFSNLEEPIADLKNSCNDACCKKSFSTPILNIDGRQDYRHAARWPGNLLGGATEKSGKNSREDCAVESGNGATRVAVECQDPEAECQGECDDGGSQPAEEVALEVFQRKTKILAESELFKITQKNELQLALVRVEFPFLSPESVDRELM